MIEQTQKEKNKFIDKYLYLKGRIEWNCLFDY